MHVPFQLLGLLNLVGTLIVLETAEKNASYPSRKEREAYTALESTDIGSNRGGGAGDGMEKL